MTEGSNRSLVTEGSNRRSLMTEGNNRRSLMTEDKSIVTGHLFLREKKKKKTKKKPLFKSIIDNY